MLVRCGDTVWFGVVNCNLKMYFAVPCVWILSHLYRVLPKSNSLRFKKSFSFAAGTLGYVQSVIKYPSSGGRTSHLCCRAKGLSAIAGPSRTLPATAQQPLPMQYARQEQHTASHTSVSLARRSVPRLLPCPKRMQTPPPPLPLSSLPRASPRAPLGGGSKLLLLRRFSSASPPPPPQAPGPRLGPRADRAAGLAGPWTCPCRPC